ncbi:hypothetical protein MAPG_00556 [Magnaporthiopsis poae ATCC 64411]|uniref:Uncharacterized protein n=1 Tax=Magnaporthiopsis poae (strain ATCC 64411 / 73-15) TaxID=644358 RepID=A0A0C4DLB5_MAGP6|nr:hypothetical protein MAPG_00556 [Magnaporthiopsis poae ATCC 64411]
MRPLWLAMLHPRARAGHIMALKPPSVILQKPRSSWARRGTTDVTPSATSRRHKACAIVPVLEPLSGSARPPPFTLAHHCLHEDASLENIRRIIRIREPRPGTAVSGWMTSLADACLRLEQGIHGVPASPQKPGGGAKGICLGRIISHGSDEGELSLYM